MLKLPLAKPGESTQTVGKLSLNLNKGSRFSVELAWESAHDLDAHALLGHNDGSGAKVTDYAQVLSTYNTKKMNPGASLTANADGSFSTPCGALTHSGDSRSGIGKLVDEIITVDGSKIQNGVNEIPIFVTIHSKAKPGTKFNEVNDASIVIKDESGKVLGEYRLTGEFAQFNAVQMGSLMLGPSGWEFAPVGNGFMGDFNTILGSFS